MGRIANATDHIAQVWAEALATVKLAVLADRSVSPREETIMRLVDGEYREAEDRAQARESRLIKREAA